MWKMSNAHEDLRPDKCGIMLEKYENKICAITDDELTPIAKEQLERFKKEGFKVSITNYGNS